MSELLRELQEDMQRERWAALWKRYGSHAIAGSVAIVLGTAGGVAYKHWNDGHHRELTSKLLTASAMEKQGKDADAALAALEKEAGGSLGGLVTLRRAEFLRAHGKDKEAAEALGAAATKADAADPYGALVQLQAYTADKNDGNALTVKGPFAATAAEIKAWKALQAGQRDEALKTFRELSQADNAPASLRERASQMAVSLEPQNKGGGDAPAN